MQQTAVINVVGLTMDLVATGCPAINAFMNAGGSAFINQALPALTCSVQSTYLTGRHPCSHGIVGNGWYDRNAAEIRFWKQSNHLVQGPKIWDLAKQRDSNFTSCNSFWWYNMYSTVDYSITPRPMYPADGRKIPDVYTVPDNLRGELQAELGQFPLFQFWGPGSDLRSSKWIAEAAKRLHTRFQPTLHLIYLPHLDYGLQRFGPAHPNIKLDLQQIDSECGDLIAFFKSHGTSVMLLSEYGIEEVSQQIHINRILRESGLLKIREELGRELLDPGASVAFAVADHQIAHVYVNDDDQMSTVRSVLESIPGIEHVMGTEEQISAKLNHPRSGDLIAVAAEGAWFTYYYWQDEIRAPDFARTVDIHQKPGYDPVELFLDPAIRFPQLTIGLKLLRRRLGLQTIMDVIPLDATLIKGSHGRMPSKSGSGPLLVSERSDLLNSPTIMADEICDLIMGHVFD